MSADMPLIIHGNEMEWQIESYVYRTISSSLMIDNQ